jgi:phage tail-like protein
MDANNQRFWLLAAERHWHRASEPPRVQFDRQRGTLRLASVRNLPDWHEDPVRATGRVEMVPRARDSFGTDARWDADTRRIVAGGAAPGPVHIFLASAGETVTDFTPGYDGVLYIAAGGAVVLQDLRGRWERVTVRSPGFVAWRLAPHPAGGVWVLDRVHRTVGLIQGLPLPRERGGYAPEAARPCPENPSPPRLGVREDLAWPASETTVGIACSAEGRLALLTWAPDGAARLRVQNTDGGVSSPVQLLGARYPYSLSWVAADRVAVLMVGLNEAPVYPLGDDVASVHPVGDLYPVRGHDGGPFVHGITPPPRYPTTEGSAPLHRLSLPSFAREGEAANAEYLDSGRAGSTWHRLYLEAAIPLHCAVVVRLAASDEPAAPIDPAAWHEHRFGEHFASKPQADIPLAAWVPAASELPFHRGLLACALEKDRAGLFTVLIQRAGRRVRALRGRYLWARVALIGDGSATPEIAALRAYAERFSYADQYLPELYRETVFGPEADSVDGATPADFLERFLGNFEGVLTPLEDRIAHAHLLTDPRAAPQEALAWLGSWCGLAFDPVYPLERRRALLGGAPRMARWRGTLRGLSLALDLATGGAVRGGEIVILEDFRLRRTFATILGADLDDEQDPLTAGLATSGNSYVGDSLFLGEEEHREFLALFHSELPVTDSEQEDIDSLTADLAHRVTVLVHQAVEPQDLGLIRRVVELESPAHVSTRVLKASHPFLVGMAALVGVDSYLQTRAAAMPVRLGRTELGVRDRVIRPPSLDPRLEGGLPSITAPEPPVADLGEDFTTGWGRSFVLDGSASRAAPGRELTTFRWTRPAE